MWRPIFITPQRHAPGTERFPGSTGTPYNPEQALVATIGLAVLNTIPAVTDTQPPSHDAVASTRYACLRRAVKSCDL